MRSWLRGGVEAGREFDALPADIGEALKEKVQERETKSSAEK